MLSPFKTLGAVTCLVFALSFAAPNVHADTVTNYTINFTGGSPLPTSGSFTYDSTVPAFSNFIVVWDGLTFNLTSSANNPTVVPPLPGCIPAGTGPAESFALLSGCASGTWAAPPGLGTFAIGIPPIGSCCPSPPQFSIFSSVGPSFSNDFGSGSYSIAAVATPEPSSLALMLSGVGLVFGMRKRWASGLQQAS